MSFLVPSLTVILFNFYFIYVHSSKCKIMDILHYCSTTAAATAPVLLLLLLLFLSLLSYCCSFVVVIVVDGDYGAAVDDVVVNVIATLVQLLTFWW